jgi:hypothetical protein
MRMKEEEIWIRALPLLGGKLPILPSEVRIG